MKSFKDNDGREWRIVVNVGSAKAVRDLVKVNLFQLHNQEAERVFSDPCLLVDVLYVLVKDQCSERKMTDEDFGRSMVGDSIEQAANALLEEIANFFPQGRRTLLQKQMKKANEITDAIFLKAEKELDNINVETILQTNSKSSIKSQASSE